jgi:SAM-dependent methyltransferase
LAKKPENDSVARMTKDLLSLALLRAERQDYDGIASHTPDPSQVSDAAQATTLTIDDLTPPKNRKATQPSARRENLARSRRVGRFLLRALRPLALPFLHRFQARIHMAVSQTGMVDSVMRLEASLAHLQESIYSRLSDQASSHVKSASNIADIRKTLESDAKVTRDAIARVALLEERQRLLRDVVVRGFWQTLDRLDDLTLAERSLTCPVCDRSEPHDTLQTRTDHCAFGGGRLERYLCPRCGCVFGPAKYLELDQDLIDADYALLYSEYSEGDSTAEEIRAFHSLNPRPGGLYLNWGCGRWTRTIPILRAQGYDVWGYDPSAPPVGSGFIATRRDAISAQFDGIFSNNVVEHMVRPVDEFRYFHSILAPGGRMAHASPCYHYRYSSTRFHVVFLTGNSPNVLAERTGFRVMAREEEGEFANVVYERE